MPGLRKGVVALLWPRNSVRSTEMQLISVLAFNGQKTQLTSASLVLPDQNIAVLEGTTGMPLGHLASCTLCRYRRVVNLK